VEAIDMGRRAIHNEGAELLIQRLDGKVEIDQDTARRLFTLIYVLQTVGSSAIPASPAAPRVLFVCTRNAVRSPMAEALLRRRRPGGPRVESAGLVGDPLDPMATAVMGECGIDLLEHRPRALADLSLADFDLVIALSREADVALRDEPPRTRIEHWEIEDPTLSEGNREVQMAAYRRVRDALDQRITTQFAR
jgi:protein-tyrosine-phosphatase